MLLSMLFMSSFDCEFHIFAIAIGSLIFFIAQLKLCLYAKHKIVKMLPRLCLIGFALDFLLYNLYLLINPGGYDIFGAAFNALIFACVFPFLCVADALACLTAHIIKKRKAKKQNSVTK